MFMIVTVIEWLKKLLKPPPPMLDHESGWNDPWWSRYQEFEEIERTGGFIEDDIEMLERIATDEWLEQRSESTSSRTRDEDWERLEDALDPISNYTWDDDEYDDPSVDDYLDWTRAQSSGSPGP